MLAIATSKLRYYDFLLASLISHLANTFLVARLKGPLFPNLES